MTAHEREQRLRSLGFDDVDEEHRRRNLDALELYGKHELHSTCNGPIQTPDLSIAGQDGS